MKKLDVNIAIVVPTRGFIFSKVMSAIERERNNTWLKTALCISHDEAIPDSFNRLVKKALLVGASHIWIIEEDVVVPNNSLSELYNKVEDITFIDYAVNGWSCSAKDQNNNLLWAGLGCTMIKRHVFEKIEYPWFRTDKVLRLNDWEWIENTSRNVYGGQDIWFFQQALANSCTIKQLDGECEHLDLVTLGRKEINNGLHRISQKERIIRQQIIKKEVGE